MQSQQTQTSQHTQYPQENILVVKRTHLFSNEPWTGMKAVDFDHYLKVIQNQKEFLPRWQMETDPTYKQIIPYLIFENNGRYFLMQRKAKASETRLQSKFSLGIGGHIREEDIKTDSIMDWARREFEEEVEYNGNLTIEPLGILNDDSNDVGKVHVGFVFLLKGDSDQISVKEELESGSLLSIDECKAQYENMESWSKIVFDFITR